MIAKRWATRLDTNWIGLTGKIKMGGIVFLYALVLY
jgi:hypothetical protein